jgi:cyclase
VPQDDPARRWFEERISLPDYDTVVIRPPSETLRTVLRSICRTTRCGCTISGRPTDGDIVVHIERRKVAFLGDLLFHGRFPWLGDCYLNGLIAALGRVLALDVDVVVPGHGPPTTLAEVARFREMLVELRAAVERSIKAGASEAAAMQEVTLPQYAHVQRYKEWMPLDVRAAYRYLRRV